MNQHVYQRRPAGNSAIPDVIFILIVAYLHCSPW